jgi:hypothetical protein
MGSDIDLAEARSFQNAAHAAGVSEREWAGRVRVVSGLRWQMSGRGLKRQDVERVFLQRSPADEGESPIRPEATSNVDKRRGGVSEEHHSEPREGSVERGRLEREHLGICLDEPHSFAPLGRALRERQHRSRQIDPYYCSVRRDCPDKVQRSLTPRHSLCPGRSHRGAAPAPPNRAGQAEQVAVLTAPGPPPTRRPVLRLGCARAEG